MLSGAYVNRHDFAKLAAGGCLAALFTATVSGPLGYGLRYTDQLERRVRTTLDDRHLQRIDVAVEQHPTLRRTIVLAGRVTKRDRKIATQLARDVPGVAHVRWAQDVTDRGAISSGFAVQYR
jgi:hypothetical protein